MTLPEGPAQPDRPGAGPGRALEEALQASRATLDQVLAMVPQAIFWKDLDGRYLGCNGVFAELAGLEPGQVVGRTDFELPWPREEAEAYRADDRAVAAANRPRPHIIEPFQPVDGVRRWVDTSKAPLRDARGQPFAVLGIIEDITGRRATEAALGQSQANLAALIESTRDLVWSVDRDYGLLAFNSTSANHFLVNYGNTARLGSKPGDLLPPERACLWPPLYERAVAEGPYGVKDYGLPDGRTLELAFNPIIRGGEVLGVSVFGKDITKTKRAEEDKERLQEQLAQAQKLEGLGCLASGVAHEMNNVLGAILGMATVQLRLATPGSAGHDGFALIAEAATRGAGTVKSLLNLARRNPGEERVLDLNALLAEHAVFLERTTLARIRLELAPGLWPVRGDAGALQRVLLDLCLNGRQAMGDQGTLTIRTRNVPAEEVEVVVEDTGCGMTREVRERALDPFFTTRPFGQGKGLGLSLAYSTLRAHQGHLELESEPGRGTKVKLRFPASKAQEGGTARDPEHLG